MRKRLLQPAAQADTPGQHPSLLHEVASWLKPSLGKLIGLVIFLAFASGAVLLANDLHWPGVALLTHAPLSAAPLLLIGLAALGFQIVVRPHLLDLFKACIVSAAFLLWGIDQLLPAGWLATTLGDIVIVLYVIDLGWMMADRLKQQGQARQESQEAAALSPRLLDLADSPTQPLHILTLSATSTRAEPPVCCSPPGSGCCQWSAASSSRAGRHRPM